MSRRAALDLPIADDTSVDKRMDWRFLDLRRPEQNLVFRVQTTFLHALRTWWVEHDFIEIHTPKLMASASESRAELFEVGYFEGTAYLAQSPQFFKQMAQPAGFGKVFEVAPAFRADPSFTSRHATEFISVDAEISWIDTHEDVMAMHEQLMVAGLTAVKEKHGDEIAAAFDVEVTVPTVPFPRIPLAEAKRIVAERGYEVPRADDDMDPEGERRISEYVKEEFGHEFVFLTDYASSIRPFYHRRHDDDAGPHQQLRPDLQRRRDLDRRPARAPHRRARRAGEGEGPRPGGARLLPRLLPLRRAAARRIRHGALARHHAAAAPAVDPRSDLPVPRTEPADALTTKGQSGGSGRRHPPELASRAATPRRASAGSG